MSILSLQLVTNHVDNDTLSGVFAYEAPLYPIPLTNAAAWTKHVISSGVYHVLEPGPNQASPGAALSFFPCGSSPAAPKPSVSVAGDGAQKLFLVEPVSQSDPADWRYNTTVLYDCKGTVGQQAAVDVSGDACVEMFVPCYDSSTVAVLSFGEHAV